MMAATSASSRELGGLAVAVGVARMYVGAHLPLDVIGGFGLGLAVDATVRRYLRS
jgi:undecaprenyl-diphosphatase